MSEVVSEIGRTGTVPVNPLTTRPFSIPSTFMLQLQCSFAKRVQCACSSLHTLLEGQPPYYSRDRARISV